MLIHGWRCRPRSRLPKWLYGLCFVVGLTLLTIAFIDDDIVIRPLHSDYSPEAQKDRVIIMDLEDSEPFVSPDELHLKADQFAVSHLNAGQSALAKADGNSGKFVMIAPLGRMGNQMFLFASAYGISRHNKRRLIHRGHFTITDIFQLDGYEEVDQKTKKSMLPHLLSAQNCAFSRQVCID
jgi:hypothetical protein